MSAGQPRFEIVRTAAGWHARFRASNGRLIWSTEVYERRRACVAAMRALPGIGTASGHLVSFYQPDPNSLRKYGFAEVRDVDER